MYVYMLNTFGVILKVVKTNQKFHLQIAQNLPVEKYEKNCQTSFSHSPSSKMLFQSYIRGPLLSLPLV